MIKKLKNFIAKLFRIKQCACPEKDEHLQLYEDSAKPETPVYTDVEGKAVKCGTHSRYKKSCPVCKEVVGIA